MAGGVCRVCEANAAKYKCPSCRAPYCSVACYKNHQSVPCMVENPVERPRSDSVESGEIPQVNGLTEDHRRVLCSSTQIQKAIQDSRLEKILRAVCVVHDVSDSVD